jgi:methyl-accepting chemotaxis protein
MDQTTQQNASLVEELATAAESMETQAQSLAKAVAIFKIASHSQVRTDSPSHEEPEHESFTPSRLDDALAA